MRYDHDVHGEDPCEIVGCDPSMHTAEKPAFVQVIDFAQLLIMAAVFLLGIGAWIEGRLEPWLAARRHRRWLRSLG